MQYFLPFWPGDDIYKIFDPWKDTWKGEEKRIWECFDKPPIDGVLVSKKNIETTNHLKKVAEKEGIHSALRFHGTVMGDCGAFSYVNDPVPPYDPVDTLDYYKNLGFDIGVTVDHLIVKTIRTSDDGRHELTESEKKERWQITINNAKKMFDESKKNKYEQLRLIGVTQGWDPESYGQGTSELLDYGFDYIGLGGLARKPSSFIKQVLSEVAEKIKKHVKKKDSHYRMYPKVGLHLFGIARINFLENMIKYGVTSFDSASPLRTSWASSNKNYLLSKDFYTAVRIPIAKDKKKKKEEKTIFQKLKDYDQENITADQLVEELEKYDSERAKRTKDDIIKTLNDKPWEKCDCEICKDIGVHVCVFRGCERNMRRGFHNVYQFHKLLSDKHPRVLAFTWCTRRKDSCEKLLPAYKRYSKSKSFITFWKNVHDLPVEVGILSAKYMLISWDTTIPNYDERLTPAKLEDAIKDLQNKLRFYNKVFFIGLGLYREAVEKASEDIKTPIEIFPKPELSRGKLDIIEYNKQMKDFRDAIKGYLKADNDFQINNDTLRQAKLMSF